MKTIIAALALGLTAPTALAQPPVVPPPMPAEVDPAAMAEARTMLAGMGLTERLDENMRQMGDTTFTTMLREFEAQNGERMPAAIEARVRGIMQEGLTRVAADIRPTLLDDSARIYARYFSAAELRELRGLLANAIMQKMNRIAPQLTNELMQIGVAASARRMPELRERLQQEISAWEADRRRRRPVTG